VRALGKDILNFFYENFPENSYVDPSEEFNNKYGGDEESAYQWDLDNDTLYDLDEFPVIYTENFDTGNTTESTFAKEFAEYKKEDVIEQCYTVYVPKTLVNSFVKYCNKKGIEIKCE
jgi:hypothetical protein